MPVPNDSPLAGLRTIQDRVADHLRQMILEGKLPPGARINSAALARELGSSTMPVREALHQLEAEEFLVFQPYRGIFVSHLSPERIEEIYIMRAALEEFAVGLGGPRLRPEDLAAMDQHLQMMRRAVQRNDPVEFYSVDRAFHEVIVAAAGRPTLLKQVQDLRVRSLRYARLYQRLPGVMPRALEESEGIMEACRSGDSGLAMRLMRQHVLSAATQVVRQVRALPQSQPPAGEPLPPHQ